MKSTLLHVQGRGRIGHMRNRTATIGGVVGGRQHGDDTGQRQRRRAVDALHPGMGMRRADEHCMRQIFEPQIVNVAATAGQEAQVFATPG